MQTGLLVKVPMFIDEGEKIIVNTNDGSYVSKYKLVIDEMNRQECLI